MLEIEFKQWAEPTGRIWWNIFFYCRQRQKHCIQRTQTKQTKDAQKNRKPLFLLWVLCFQFFVCLLLSCYFAVKFFASFGVGDVYWVTTKIFDWKWCTLWWHKKISSLCERMNDGSKFNAQVKVMANDDNIEYEANVIGAWLYVKERKREIIGTGKPLIFGRLALTERSTSIYLFAWSMFSERGICTVYTKNAKHIWICAKNNFEFLGFEIPLYVKLHIFNRSKHLCECESKAFLPNYSCYPKTFMCHFCSFWLNFSSSAFWL